MGPTKYLEYMKLSILLLIRKYLTDIKLDNLTLGYQVD